MSPDATRDAPSPGAEVVIFGLQGHPEFNGQRGVVKPLADWPENGRVPVLLVHQEVRQ